MIKRTQKVMLRRPKLCAPAKTYYIVVKAVMSGELYVDVSREQRRAVGGNSLTKIEISEN